MEFLQEDFESLCSHIQFEENQLKMKRRWLVGLPTTSKSEQRRLKTPKFLINVSLPESLLRDDDVSYEIIRTSVERGFKASTGQRGDYVVQDYLHLIDTNNLVSDISRVLPSVLDDMNNIGLFHLADVTTGKSVKIEKTRWRMKEIIKEYLPKILGNPNHKYYTELLTQLPQLLKDPHNFRENHVTLTNSTAMSHHFAVTKVLEGLENMPSRTLNAMHRKLRGIRIDIHQMQLSKSGWNRGRLIELLRNTCKKMLSDVNEEGELQKPLAKAMAVAALSLKITEENPNLSMPEFFHFSPEIEALHNEILKAIWVLKEMNIRNLEAKDLQHLLNPKKKIPIAHLRGAIRRMLTEYLFECCEMDIIPSPLLETLASINRSSQSVATLCFSKEDIEKEVESVLNVSSQIKCISWDLLGDHKIDEEFTSAYMEDLQESDDDDQRLELNCSPIVGSDFSDDEESVGESRPVNSILLTNTTNGSDSCLLSTPGRNLKSNSFEESQPEPISDPNPWIPHDFGSSFSSPCHESSFQQETQNTSENQYLAIQEICDQTSLVAHQLIGRLLGTFLQMEGVDLEKSERSYLWGGLSNPEDSRDDKEMQTSSEDDIGGPVLVRVVEELLPSLPKSEMKRVKELMGVQ